VPLDSEEPAALVSLTAEQVTRRWPHLAADVGLHDYACPVGNGPTLVECEAKANRWQHAACTAGGF
jgi:hypothetical protein